MPFSHHHDNFAALLFKDYLVFYENTYLKIPPCVAIAEAVHLLLYQELLMEKD